MPTAQEWNALLQQMKTGVQTASTSPNGMPTNGDAINMAASNLGQGFQNSGPSYAPQTMDYSANPMLASMLAQQANTDNRSQQMNQQRFAEGQGKGSAINDYLASAYGKILGVNFGGMGGNGGGGSYGGGGGSSWGGSGANSSPSSYSSGYGSQGVQNGNSSPVNMGGYQPPSVNYGGTQAQGGSSDVPLIDQMMAKMGINPAFGEKMESWDQYQAQGKNPFKSYADWQKAAQQHDTYHTAVNQIVPRMLQSGYTLEDLGIYDEAEKGKALYNAYRDINGQVKAARANGTNPLMMPTDLNSAMGIYNKKPGDISAGAQAQGPQTSGQAAGKSPTTGQQTNTSSSMAPPQGNYNNNPSMPPMGPPQMNSGAMIPAQPTDAQASGPTAQTVAQPQMMPQTGQAIPQPQRVNDYGGPGTGGYNDPARFAPSSVPLPSPEVQAQWKAQNPGMTPPWTSVSPSGGTASQHNPYTLDYPYPNSNNGGGNSGDYGAALGPASMAGPSGLGNWGGAGSSGGGTSGGSSSYGYSTGNGQSFDPNQNSTWAQFLAPTYNKVSQLGDQQMRELRSALPRGGQQDSAISGAINNKYSTLMGGWQGLVPQAMQGLQGVGNSYYNQSPLGQTGGVGNATNYELGLKGLQSSGVGQSNSYNLGVQGLQSSERNAKTLAESQNNSAKTGLFGQLASGLVGLLA